MMDLIKSTQAGQIQRKSDLKDLQESIDFISAEFGEYENEKKKVNKKYVYQKMI